MKVLYVTTVAKTMHFFVNQIKFLNEKGYTIDIACNMESQIPDELLEFIGEKHDISFQRKPFSFKNFNAFQQIQSIVEQNDYDLIHLHTPIASFITRIATRNKCDAKIIYTAHGFHFFSGGPLINWLLYYPLEKLAARWTDKLIVINNMDFKIAVDKLFHEDSERVSLINGVGIDASKFNQEAISAKKKQKLLENLNLYNNDYILICIGELNNNKNQQFLIKEIGSLKKRIPNIKLLLVGEGPLKNEYIRLVKRLDVEENVVFTGFRNDISELLKISNVLVSASYREGLPVNVMEAMTTGLPCVVTNIRGNVDLIQNSKNGYLYEINNSAAYHNSIFNLYNDEKLTKNIVNNNLYEAFKYDVNSINKDILSLYKNIISSETITDRKERG